MPDSRSAKPDRASPTPTGPRPLTRRRMVARLGALSLVAGLMLLAGGWWFEQPTVLELGWLCAGLGAIWLLCARFTSHDPLRDADRRYLREFFPAMAAYLLVLMLIWPLAGRVDSPTLGVLIALLPAVPVLFVAHAIVRRILAGDELERRMHLEATAVASLLVGMLSLSTGLLQASGRIELEAGLIWVFPAMIAVWGLALWWAKRRYRAE